MAKPYLVAHPPKRSQFRTPRRERVSGVLVAHTGESAIEEAGLKLAAFIRGRSDPGSYHNVIGWKSWLRLSPYDAEAFGDGTGSNRHAIHLSFACKAADWPQMPSHVKAGFIEQGAQAAADAARWVKSETGIVVPARRIDRPASEARRPGFISHGERDPSRRTDPGKQFPWGPFLERFARLTGWHAGPIEPPEDDVDAAEVKAIVDAEGHEIRKWTREELKRQLKDIRKALGLPAE